MKSFGEFDLSMYDAILNTGNSGSFYVLSVEDSVKIAISKASFSSYHTSLTLDYKYIFGDTADFDSEPGGKLDVFYSSDTEETESWFVCSSQTYEDTPAVSYVLFYNVVVVDGFYQSSTRHIYETWAKCVGTHQLS